MAVFSRVRNPGSKHQPTASHVTTKKHSKLVLRCVVMINTHTPYAPLLACVGPPQAHPNRTSDAKCSPCGGEEMSVPVLLITEVTEIYTVVVGGDYQSYNPLRS